LLLLSSLLKSKDGQDCLFTLLLTSSYLSNRTPKGPWRHWARLKSSFPLKGLYAYIALSSPPALHAAAAALKRPQSLLLTIRIAWMIICAMGAMAVSNPIRENKWKLRKVPICRLWNALHGAGGGLSQSLGAVPRLPRWFLFSSAEEDLIMGKPRRVSIIIKLSRLRDGGEHRGS